MPVEQRKTGERLLQAGLGLMSQEGLSGVTLGRLAQQVGMSKSGVFAHFRSKEDVQLALLEYASEFTAPFILEPAMREPAGLPRLEAFMRSWFGWSARAGLPGGCPIAAAMFELDDIESPIRDKVLQMEAQFRGVLCEIVAHAVRLHELREDLDVEQFVFELCGFYLCHHVSLRFVRDPKADARAQTSLRELIERSRPVPA